LRKKRAESSKLVLSQKVNFIYMNLSPTHSATLSPPWVLFSLYQLQQHNRFWAFKRMGRSTSMLNRSERMPFGLMLGTGSGRGFGIFPNWERYALLTCWHSPEDAEAFLSQSSFARELQQRSKERWTVLMQPVISKGTWAGKNPFFPHAASLSATEPLVVLTRATIHLKRLPEFWKYVPQVSESTEHTPGLLFKTGIGEVPLVQQATVSLWKDQQSLDAFAYKMKQHRTVVGLTRTRNWYSEELFARFRPLQSWGTLEGQNPLLLPA
jgi:hypothetical protein